MSTIPPPGPARLDAPADWAAALAAGPHYEPPYPGAVQDELAWHLVKYLRDDARLRSEVEVEVPPSHGWPTTGTGPAFFTLDLVVDVPVETAAGASVRRVAFEAAGGRGLREHDRRLRRDAALLATGAVDTVYRLRGSDLLDRMADVLYLATRWESEGAGDPFSARGRVNLATLASPEARQIALRPEQPSVLVPYAFDDATARGAAGGSAERTLWHVANGQAPHVLVRRLDRRCPDVWSPYAEPALRLVEVERATPASRLRKAS